MGRIWNSELSIVDVTRSAEYSCVQEFWSSCSRRNEERAVQTNGASLMLYNGAWIFDAADF